MYLFVIIRVRCLMEVLIEKLDNFGRGIAYVNDKICFIENALINEKVDIKIIKEHKKYLEGEVINYIEKSPIRIEEECPYSRVCGGCNLNHMCNNEENKFKQNKIKDLAKKYANIEKEKIKNIQYNDRNHYRNKITLHGKDGVLGLYKKDTNDIIPIKECLLVSNKINEIIKVLNRNNINIEEAIIKVSNNDQEVMVSIRGEVKEEELLKVCDVLIINNEYKTSKKQIATTINNKKYIESINSFFQVNNTLTKELYDEALNTKEYDTILDLYCGTGTIGIYVGEKAKKIIGIDYNKSNIEDANLNKELNHLENIEFICDKVENKIDSFKNIDKIIVDPPRAGLDEKTRKYLKEILPEEIVYISCDPLTLMRDLKDLQEKYEVEYIKPFNMFPRTYHVECVCLLCRKN